MASAFKDLNVTINQTANIFLGDLMTGISQILKFYKYVIDSLKFLIHQSLLHTFRGVLNPLASGLRELHKSNILLTILKYSIADLAPENFGCFAYIPSKIQ